MRKVFLLIGILFIFAINAVCAINLFKKVFKLKQNFFQLSLNVPSQSNLINKEVKIRECNGNRTSTTSAPRIDVRTGVTNTTG